MLKDAERSAQEKMQHSIEVLKKELGTIRTGRATPALLDRVKVQYTGRLLDGTVFDSSEKRGGVVESQVNKLVMPAMREALVIM